MDPVHFMEQSHVPQGQGDLYLSSRMGNYINFYSNAQVQQRMKLASHSNLELVDPIECAERVEAMVSTALLHQEDIWDMLLHLFPDYTASDDGSSAEGITMDIMSQMKPAYYNSSSAPDVAAIKRKLENAMDWCRLAQCRLQGVITEHNSSHGSPQRRAQIASAPGCLHRL